MSRQPELSNSSICMGPPRSVAQYEQAGVVTLAQVSESVDEQVQPLPWSHIRDVHKYRGFAIS
jgi:hypothetical protein